MGVAAATELILIRHAPALTGGRLCGRTDVPADCGDRGRVAALRAAVGVPDRIVTSPALRCRQTAAALWPVEVDPLSDAALWEQDFGDWEGRAPDALPDLGPLSPAALAQHRPPGGESFADLCARVAPALIGAATGGRVAIVAHAGTVRAGLALALGSVPRALAFDVAPLSLTRLWALPDGGWSIATVNWCPA
ncbi:histidine phosphatase family protein [Defluviimonas sp. SAOS-178_SWC]|uniref:histidine phosphatase family protein n=1 Tax=Defluviimonas sp. SAOS-178_SWC TaxID=3121287 RepID=UPI003221F1AA